MAEKSLIKKRLFIAGTIYLAMSIGLSFFWQYLPFKSSQKGDDIISCIGLMLISAFVYSVIAKLVVGKSFPVTLMVITPVVSFIISIIVLIIGNMAVGGASDYLNLQILFFLNGVFSVACIFLAARYSIRYNKS